MGRPEFVHVTYIATTPDQFWAALAQLRKTEEEGRARFEQGKANA